MRKIRGLRDSLGAPIEPDEELPVAMDWMCDDVYEGDYVYRIDGDLVKEDDLKNYIETIWGKSKPYEGS